MKTTTKIISAVCLATSLALAASTSQAQNLLINPGFETAPGGSPDLSGWSLFNGAAYSTAFARSGTHSMFDGTVNNVPGSFEQFAASPGQQYELTGFGMTPATLVGSPAFGIVQIAFFDAGNNNLGTVETGAGNAKGSAQINGSSTPGVFTFLDTGIATAPANTAFIQAFTLYVDFSGNNQGVYFDDLSLTQVVPEPSTTALMGLGLLGLCFTIRRRSLKKAA